MTWLGRPPQKCIFAVWGRWKWKFWRDWLRTANEDSISLNFLCWFQILNLRLSISWEKSFETWFVYFAIIPKRLTRIKCFQKKTEWLVWNFFKNSQLCVVLWTKPDNNLYFILLKKKRIIYRQPRKRVF